MTEIGISESIGGDEKLDPPTEILALLTGHLLNDSQVLGAWLEGSFGRAENDRYSDIDLHVYADRIESLHGFAQQLLAKVGEPVLLKELRHAGQLVHSLLRSGVRVDVMLHQELPTKIPTAGSIVLLDREGEIAQRLSVSNLVPPSGDNILGMVEEFWRCIGMLPVGLGRGELIVAFYALGMEAINLASILGSIKTDILPAGVKRVNRLLAPHLRKRLEDALSLPTLDIASLAKGHLELAAIMVSEGRTVAEIVGFRYPEELEATALNYVKVEFALLGLPEHDLLG